MKYLIVLISILLDMVIYNFFNTIRYPMFTIVGISFISKYFNKRNVNNYYVFILFISIIYDVLITNNFFLTLFLFYSVSFLNIYLDKLIKNTFISNLIKVILSIILYDLLFYLVLVIIRYYLFDYKVLLYKFYNSIIINSIYGSILFLVLKKDKH